MDVVDEVFSKFVPLINVQPFYFPKFCEREVKNLVTTIYSDIPKVSDSYMFTKVVGLNGNWSSLQLNFSSTI